MSVLWAAVLCRAPQPCTAKACVCQVLKALPPLLRHRRAANSSSWEVPSGATGLRDVQAPSGPTPLRGIQAPKARRRAGG